MREHFMLYEPKKPFKCKENILLKNLKFETFDDLEAEKNGLYKLLSNILLLEEE